MLEALLKHFRSYGMEDLEFIIVNSKLSHAQDKLEELTKRVSFEVYQETDEEEVWSVMEGGKDDMFVYDRCGRLTYYIPFPLSILHESPLVSNAILATYFRSPCGDNCDQNKTVETNEIVKDIERDYDSNVTEEGNSTYTETELPIFNNETTDEMSFSNDLLYVTTPENNETDIWNFNNTQNSTDYEYPAYDSNFQMNEANATKVEEAKSFFSSIYKLFFNSKSNDDKMSGNTDLIRNLNETSNLQGMTHNDTKNEVMRTFVHHNNHAHHGHSDDDESNIGDQRKSNRCLEADYEVCKSWSKKRLLYAQRCCSGIHSGPQNQKWCNHFGKKRCKKMQSIFKCCIKTVYTEPDTTASTDEESVTAVEVPTMISIEESANATPKEEQTSSTQVADVVCCKTVNEGKECRVSYSGGCEEEEYIESSPKK